MVEKAEKKEELILGLASSDDVGAGLRAARIMLSSQDAHLNYTAAVNPSFVFAEDATLVGRSDADLLPAAASEKLTACKQRVAATGKGESIDISLSRDDGTQWFRFFVEPLAANGQGHGIL